MLRGPILSVFVLSNVPPLIDDHDGFDGIYWTAGPSVDANCIPNHLQTGLAQCSSGMRAAQMIPTSYIRS